MILNPNPDKPEKLQVNPAPGGIWSAPAGSGIKVSLSAVVAAGHYGEVGLLYLFL